MTYSASCSNFAPIYIVLHAKSLVKISTFLLILNFSQSALNLPGLTLQNVYTHGSSAA